MQQANLLFVGGGGRVRASLRELCAIHFLPHVANHIVSIITINKRREVELERRELGINTTTKRTRANLLGSGDNVNRVRKYVGGRSLANARDIFIFYDFLEEVQDQSTEREEGSRGNRTPSGRNTVPKQRCLSLM